MSVHFSLSDIDSEIPTKIGTSSFKPLPTHFLSKKRKVEDLYDINNPSSNLLIAADVMIEEYTDKVKTVEALTFALNKGTRELEKAKQKIKDLKIKLADKSSREEGSNNNLLEEMKRDATIAVLESKIHMATEAAENGLDASLWDVKGWKDKLARMKDDYPSNPYVIGLGRPWIQKGKSTKISKPTAPETVTKGEASNSRNIEKVVAAVDLADSEGSSGEEGI